MKRGDSEMQKPRFDYSFNLGHVMQAGVIVAGFLSTLLYLAGERAEIKRDIEISRDARLKYVPVIEAMASSNQIQDERITGLGLSVQDIRKTNNEMLLQLGAIREDLAGIKARLNPQR